MAKSKLQDFDPEALLDPNPSSSEDENSAFDDSEVEEDTNAGREHYADVGKSKIRKKEAVPLGPQYTGSRIRRDEIEDEEDDPFARSYDIAGSDEDEDSDDPFAKTGAADGSEEEEEEEEEDLAIGNGIAGSGGEDEEIGSFDGSEDSVGEDDDEDMGDFDDDEGDDSEEDEDEGEDEDDTADISSKIRSMMNDTAAISSTISQAAKADAEKGLAIKTQRKTYDNLLNARIKLQGGLIASNSLVHEANTKLPAPQDAVVAAEAAALKLLNHLTALRESLDSSRAGQKRKRTPFTSSSSSADIWSSIKDSDSATLAHRNAVMNKWSAKTRGATVSTGKLTGNTQQSITDVLGAQLRDPSRLVARTQVPRSCAPLQAAAQVTSSISIYDDADFYSLLLKELLESRSAELNANGIGEFVVSQPYELMRQAKTKKIVDTKASKGRKLRYTVHEKLQNFMAPEDRNEWGERQREDLFVSLFGRKGGLREEEESDASDDENIDAEEEGLMLFRT